MPDFESSDCSCLNESANSKLGTFGGKAWSLSDQRKSVPFCTAETVCVTLWHAMQPVKILAWSKVSNVVLANAVVAPLPGNVLPGVPRIDGSHVGRHNGHCVITSW